MLSKLLLAIASAATLVSSQTIDPSSVPLSTRQVWCNSQKSSCPLICLQFSSGVPIANNCTAETLTYSCICSNNVSPNASEYSQTLPYYICTEAGTQCVNACDNSACQSACRSDHPCGAQDPPRVNVSTTTTTSSAAATSTTPGNILTTGEATGGAPRPYSVERGHVYGLCVLVGGLVTGFAVLL
ncbi:hypothetical protein N7462_011504 [Penicillium macrosclerotiorum]|uniref:uncharacterized protein n=1 Tax=Penicillium macrosclerotiorum TaxID=303699 RepID=UPI0025488E80|nr:uncharacterized protein N7462_011504 [Penicillium macrosclerotiorum]KAJ5664691.1 hypothetical protein N7462_011504 [Penicillium macrosclerotiorum]